MEYLARVLGQAGRVIARGLGGLLEVDGHRPLAQVMIWTGCGRSVPGVEASLGHWGGYVRRSTVALAIRYQAMPYTGRANIVVRTSQ